MELYALVKFFHVVSAIVWVGGGAVLALLGFFALRARDEAALFTAARQMSFVGPRVFLPASLSTLSLGLGMVWVGGLAWEAWLVLGLAGTVATALFGQFVLKPRGERVAKLLAEPAKRRDAIRQTEALFRLARVDYGVLFAVIAVMVLKPGWSDPGALLLAAALPVAGLLASLRTSRPAAA